MTIKLSFLFIAFLSALLFNEHADAMPAGRKSRIITMPLMRLHEPKGDVHPQVLLQQHTNRAQRRYAQLMGRKGPSDEELRQNLRRMYILPNGYPTTESLPAKRSSANGSDTTFFTPSFDLHMDILGRDVGYFATVQIGTPPQEFNVTIDSGSADFWVGSTNCQTQSQGSNSGCGNHVFLGPETSSSFISSGNPWKITYGSGAASGVKVNDNVIIAGITLTNHSFGVANVESTQFSDSFGSNPSPDGLMGLSLSSLSTQKVLTPVAAMAKQGLIPSATVSFKLSRFIDGTNDGEVTFGGLDPSKFDPSTLITVDNLDDGFWVAGLDDITVDGSSIKANLDSNGNRTAILDTGTTLLCVPEGDLDAIHEVIPGAVKDEKSGSWKVPCNMTASVALTIGGKAFDLDPRDIARGSATNLQKDTGLCGSGIVSLGSEKQGTQWLAGDTFLKSVYLSLDAGQNKISLAKLKQ